MRVGRRDLSRRAGGSRAGSGGQETAAFEKAFTVTNTGGAATTPLAAAISGANQSNSATLDVSATAGGAVHVPMTANVVPIGP